MVYDSKSAIPKSGDGAFAVYPKLIGLKISHPGFSAGGLLTKILS